MGRVGLFGPALSEVLRFRVAHRSRFARRVGLFGPALSEDLRFRVAHPSRSCCMGRVGLFGPAFEFYPFLPQAPRHFGGPVRRSLGIWVGLPSEALA